MDNSGTTETKAQLIAELSREISALVARILAGEAVDRIAAGAALAVRYAELGMSAELIAKAVDRSVAMVDDSRNVPAPAAATPACAADESPACGLMHPADSPSAPENSPPPVARPSVLPLRARQPSAGAIEQGLASLRRLAGRFSRRSSVERREPV